MSDTAQTRTTLDQRRAAHALERIRELAGTSKPGHYVSHVSALPAVIVGNGLGQALATELAKGRKDAAHRHLYEHVAAWLTEQIPELAGDTDELLDRLMARDQDVYLRAQMEAMAYVHWLKQFARAYLDEPEGQEP